MHRVIQRPVGRFAYEFWFRCELCNYSGKRGDFHYLYSPASWPAYVCKSEWCWGSPLVRQQLLEGGWTEVR